MKRSWLLLALLAGTALAGCLHGNGDNGDTPTDPTSPGPTPPAPAQPAPTGSALGATDIASFWATFNDQPFAGGQGSPEHVWKWVTDDTFIGLHFNHAQPALADALLWIVIGHKGVFCAETQPGSGFTHFHQWNSTTWDAGHGGLAGDQGYWLLHIGVDEFSTEEWDVSPGTDYNFMPTPPPACDEGVPEVDFSPSGAGNLTAQDITVLNAIFDDRPFRGGQDTPGHVWKWVNEEVFIFLHYNHADPGAASALNWYGIGVRGEFCRDAQPHTDFTHFHKWESRSWDAGHGGPPRAQGYWLLHAGVHEFSADGRDVEVGVDHNFMPTPPTAC